MRVFLCCAAAGGAFLVLQFLLGVLGVHHHRHHGGHHVSHHHGGRAGGRVGGRHGAKMARTRWGSYLTNLQSIAAAFAFFGLGGAAVLSSGAAVWSAVAVGAVAGVAGASGVAAMLRSMTAFESDGTLPIDAAIGALGQVYVSIPARQAGRGKVHVTVRDRLVEYEAVTNGEALASGAPVLVTDVAGTDALVVCAVDEPTLLQGN
jgi:hypothetical protein